MTDTPRQPPAEAAIVVVLPREIDMGNVDRAGEDPEAALAGDGRR